ncbi:hypothetical protein [Bordetella sp. LUAb4]|nr:hypothetical protein [Bordetella sp. LUAb4]
MAQTDPKPNLDPRPDFKLDPILALCLGLAPARDSRDRTRCR